jgi:hypothetical protein
MSAPKKIKIGGVWYDVRSGFSVAHLVIIDWKDRERYTATSMDGILYSVYDISSSQVGDFNITNGSCSGRVDSIEM